MISWNFKLLYTETFHCLEPDMMADEEQLLGEDDAFDNENLLNGQDDLDGSDILNGADGEPKSAEVST